MRIVVRRPGGHNRADDDGEEEVRQEVEESGRYLDCSGEWSVCIESIDEK